MTKPKKEKTQEQRIEDLEKIVIDLEERLDTLQHRLRKFDAKERRRRLQND